MNINIDSHETRSLRWLHVHCARSMARASPVPDRGAHLTAYSERALFFACPGDVVGLHSPPHPNYLEYLNRLGIGPRPSDIIACPDTPETAQAPLVVKLARDESAWERVVARLQSADEVFFQPYMATRFEREFTRRLRPRLRGNVRLIGGNCSVLEEIDHKHRARATAIELGIPVAPGEVVQVASHGDWHRLSAAIQRFLSHTGSVIVRGSSADSGSSVLVIRGEREVAQAIKQLQDDANRIFLVDVMYEVTRSPNIGLFIDPLTGAISCFSSTEQVLNQGLRHLGNRYPPEDSRCYPEMYSAAERFARYLCERGVTGYLGFDFCEYDSSDGKPSYFLAEINPRINGSTYQQHLFTVLNRTQRACGGPALECYFGVSLESDLADFAALNDAIGELFFQPGQECGVVPYCLENLIRGKCGMFVIATNKANLRELYESVRARLRSTAARRAA